MYKVIPAFEVESDNAGFVARFPSELALKEVEKIALGRHLQVAAQGFEAGIVRLWLLEIGLDCLEGGVVGDLVDLAVLEEEVFRRDVLAQVLFEQVVVAQEDLARGGRITGRVADVERAAGYGLIFWQRRHRPSWRISRLPDAESVNAANGSTGKRGGEVPRTPPAPLTPVATGGRGEHAGTWTGVAKGGEDRPTRA